MFDIFPHLAADTVDVRAFGAVELAAVVEEALGAVAGDGGAEAGDLLLHPGLVLHTPGDVCPGPIILHQTSSFKEQLTLNLSLYPSHPVIKNINLKHFVLMILLSSKHFKQSRICAYRCDVSVAKYDINK